MNQWGNVCSQILALLADVGPMTRSEICSNLGRDKHTVASIVSRLNKVGRRTGKRRIYITHYVYDMEGERMYPRAVYALGNKENAARPVKDVKATKARYWARRKARYTQNSVFNLAMTRKQFEERKKAA